jgi:DNA-directed RNA polymerase subunit RPC12/RpoP
MIKQEVNKRYECFDCKKKYSHIEKCKDGQQRCKRCKKKLPTNKFYNPNWRKENQFIGKFSINGIEKKMLITKYIKKGCSYEQAKNNVNFDINKLKKLKNKKYIEQKEQEKQEQNNKELNKKLAEGFGQKKR